MVLVQWFYDHRDLVKLIKRKLIICISICEIVKAALQDEFVKFPFPPFLNILLFG